MAAFKPPARNRARDGRRACGQAGDPAVRAPTRKLAAARVPRRRCAMDAG